MGEWLNEILRRYYPKPPIAFARQEKKQMKQGYALQQTDNYYGNGHYDDYKTGFA